MNAIWMGTEVSLLVAIFALTLVLGDVLPAERPLLGHRGEQRGRALAGSALFRLAEPLILQMAAWVACVVPRSFVEPLGERLTRAGHWLGLTPDEFVAVSLLATLFGGAAAAASVEAQILSPLWALPGAALVGAVPGFRLGAEENRRKMEMDRRLPAAIDLVALCMSAGADLPAAVRLVVGERSARDIARDQLAVVLQELELGLTRAEALSRLARRVPCEAVRGLVAAVVQAEEKGSPLSEILQIQATVLRGRRSVLAEEAAARAGVLMVAPLLLLLVCILVLLMGPFLLTGGI